MAAKKDSKPSAAKKTTSAKSKSGGKKGSGILDKVKDAAGEILSGAAQGAAATAINIGAEVVSDLLSGGKKDSSTKAKAGGDAGTKGTGSAGKTTKSSAKTGGDAGTKGTGSAGKSTKSGGKTSKSGKGK